MSVSSIGVVVVLKILGIGIGEVGNTTVVSDMIEPFCLQIPPIRTHRHQEQIQ